MAVKIRLARRGSKKRPFYDIIAIDSRKKRDGKPLEKLGYFNPMVDKETEQRKKLVVVRDSVEKWLKDGAIPSETVAKKLASIGFEGLEKFIEPVKTLSIGVSKKEITKQKAEQAEITKQKAKQRAEAKKKAEQEASASNA
jgi:small subunit ribosomal protein S16